MKKIEVFACDFCDYHDKDYEAVKAHESSQHIEELTWRAVQAQLDEKFQTALMGAYSMETDDWDTQVDDGEVEVTNVEFSIDESIEDFNDIKSFSVVENVEGHRIINYTRRLPE